MTERALRILTALLIVGYSGALALSPGSLTPENNPALAFDSMVLGTDHLFRGGLDPEGLFSSVSALATVLLGYAAGRAIARRKSGSAAPAICAAGVSGIALGWLWGLWLPVCKDLWTGPYVLVTDGWASVVFALCHWACSTGAMRSFPLQALGRHSLLFFIASGITARLLLAIRIGDSTLWARLYDLVFATLLGRNGFSSFAFAASYLAAGWLAVLALDARARRCMREQ